MVLAVISLLYGIGLVAAGVLMGVSGVPLLTAVGFLVMILGGAIAAVGYGLYKGREWARVAAMVFYGVSMGLGVFSITIIGVTSAIGFAQILISIAVIVYLNTSTVTSYFTHVKKVGTLARAPAPAAAPAAAPAYAPRRSPPPQPRASYPAPATSPYVQRPPSPPPVSSMPTEARGREAMPQVAETVAGASVPSYTLELPTGKRIRVVNEVVRVFGREDFIGTLPQQQLAAISRRSKGGHFRITAAARPDGTFEYHIEDLNSVNGTRVNGEEIRGAGPRVLENGDIVEVGGVLRMRFLPL